MGVRKNLVLFLFFATIINVLSQEKIYKCGVYDDNIPERPAINYDKNYKNDPSSKRRAETESEEFQDFHIYLDLVNIKNHIQQFNLQQYENLYINSMKNAVKTLESLLKVKKPSKPFKFTDKQIQDIHIDDWNKTMLGDSSTGNMLSLNIDLILLARIDDTMSESTLASAGSRYSDTENGRPLLGVVNINPSIDYTKLNSDHAFQSTILHEFTHVLGFSGSHFKNKFHNIFNKTDEDGVVRQYINSPKVLEVARKYFNCSSIDGVELEEHGGDGTVGSHWEARILKGDYMNGFADYDEEVISEFTLALLEDTGYYKPNYYTGGLMRYGKGKGCDFVKKKCVISGNINTTFENEFFDTFLSPYGIDSSCSSNRQSRTYQFLGEYEDIPSYYRYFENEKLGGDPAADYCPVPRGLTNERKNNYYVGSCSTLGDGDYGTYIYYKYSWIEPFNETHHYTKTSTYYNKSGDLTDMTGETLSEQSFCYQSTLIKNDINFNSTIPRATCYESFCSNRSLTIKIIMIILYAQELEVK